jgi:hypothetical protein
MVPAGPHASMVPVIILSLTACVAPADPTPLVAPVARAEATRNDISLSAVAASAVVAAGDVIEVTATLERRGPDPQELTGSGSGLVFFSVTRLEDGLTTGPPGSRLDCRSYVLSPDEPMTVPFAKSGGSTPDDPNAEFMEAYFADPDLTLPPGTWRIDVSAIGNIGRECGGDVLIDLAVELIVFVTPAGR